MKFRLIILLTVLTLCSSYAHTIDGHNNTLLFDKDIAYIVELIKSNPTMPDEVKKLISSLKSEAARELVHSSHISWTLAMQDVNDSIALLLQN